MAATGRGKGGKKSRAVPDELTPRLIALQRAYWQPAPAEKAALTGRLEALLPGELLRLHHLNCLDLLKRAQRPPPDDEFEVGWQLHPDAWGHGYASEAGLALARWAFAQGIEQVIAVVRPANTRAAATVRRIGMEWVGETEKYHNLRLQQFRLRPADLTASA